MAEKLWTDYSLTTGIAPDDTLLLHDTSQTTVGIKMIRVPAAFLFAPDGTLYNGKIVPTVTSNNLTLTLQTSNGATPSATNPVIVKIAGTLRVVSAALSVTKNAATNWFGSGGATFATYERDYFAYAIWNTGPATPIVDIGFSTRPYFNIYSDASATTTNENYLAYGNASAPNAGDDMVVIGRFAATLSASASYNWSVPTFTTKNLIQRPIFNTRPLTFAPQWTNLTVGNGTLSEATYRFDNDVISGDLNFTLGSTSSISGDVTIGVIATPASALATGVYGLSRLNDTGTSAFSGVVTLSSTLMYLRVLTVTGSYVTQAVLSSTVPHTWANTDIINLVFSYRMR